MSAKPKKAEDFYIGIVCPLAIEALAMRLMLDERYERQSFSTENMVYDIGRIGKHDVVIATLPSGHTGIANAASVTKEMLFTFKDIKILLLVGIGGGVPSSRHDIRLGDVVVSSPERDNGGVVWYDFGTALEQGFKADGAVNAPSEQLLRYLTAVQTDHMEYAGTDKAAFLSHLNATQSNPHLRNPGGNNDFLFEKDYPHVGGDDCSQCDANKLVERAERNPPIPSVRYGTIASGNQLVRSAKHRDDFNEAYGGKLLCFEMEAAGLMNMASCLVIRGISDYADSHKRGDKAWHGYASATAAAFAKEYINVIPSKAVDRLQLVSETLEVPNRRFLNFVGREKELTRIKTALAMDPSGDPQIVVIRAMGGQGKSQLALEYCRIMRKTPLSAIFWVDASSESTLKQDFELISESLKPKELLLETAESKVSFVLETLQTWPNPWHMVLDNYDSPKDFENIREYIPPNEKGKVIVTSRHSGTDFLTEEENLIELEGLAPDDARELLLTSSRISERNHDTRTLVKQIVDRLGYHPLAIAQAAAYIWLRKLPLEDFLVCFERQRREILDTTTSKFSDYRKRLSSSEKEKSISVFATWELSYRQLENESIDKPYITDLLNLLAFFDSTNISEDLFRAYCTHEDAAYFCRYPSEPDMQRGSADRGESENRTLPPTAAPSTRPTFESQSPAPGVFLGQYVDYWDSVAYSSAVGTFTQLSLVQPFDKAEDGFYHVSLHPLIRDWIRLRLNFKDCQRYSKIAATCIYRLLSLTPRVGGYLMPLSWRQAMVAHIKVLETNSNDFSLSKASMFLFQDADVGVPEHDIATLFWHNGQYLEAQYWFTISKDKRQEVLGEKHPHTLNAMSNLAQILLDLGKFNTAESVLRQTLSLRKEVLGEIHSSTLTSMGNLAQLLIMQGKCTEAEPMVRKTLSLFEKYFSTEHQNILYTMNHLVMVLLQLGKYTEADSVAREALFRAQIVWDREHVETTYCMSNLATVLWFQEKWSEAADMLCTIIARREKTLGKEHPASLHAMSALGEVLRRLGKCAAAVLLGRETLLLCKKTLGQKHPRTFEAMGRYALALKSCSRVEDAESLMRQCLELQKNVLGIEHSDTLTSMHNLAWILHGQNKEERAESLYWEALALRQKVLGMKHPDTIRTLENLAILLEGQDRQKEAEELRGTVPAAPVHSSVAESSDLFQESVTDSEVNKSIPMQLKSSSIRRRKRRS